MTKKVSIYSFALLPKNHSSLGVAYLFVLLALLCSISSFVLFRFWFVMPDVHKYFKLFIILSPLFLSSFYFNWVYAKASKNYEEYLKTLSIDSLKSLISLLPEQDSRTSLQKMKAYSQGELGSESITRIKSYLKNKQEIDDEPK